MTRRTTPPDPSKRPVVVAVDAGSVERGVDALAGGVVEAVGRRPGVECVLVGPEDELRACVPHDVERVRMHPSAAGIAMDDDPVSAVRNRRDASTLAAMRLVSSGQADGVLTSANTGAVVLAGGACLRRLKGVLHPALATVLPRPGMEGAVLLDCGASVVRSPEWMAQYAALGSVMARELLGFETPKVGLVANGTEAIKGDDVIRAADGLLRGMDGYVGPVEPWHILGGRIDVLVADGLIGNLIVKSVEMGTWTAVAETWRAFADVDDPFVRAKVDDATAWVRRLPGYGGLLLGVAGVVVKIHGENADSSDIVGGLELVEAAVHRRLPDRLADAVSLAAA